MMQTFGINHKTLVKLRQTLLHFLMIKKVYMKSDDFFTMIDEYSDTNMMYDAWRMLKEQVDQNTLKIIKKIEEDFSIDVDKFYKEMREKQL